ncbi:MAG TPA: heat-inducible transcriptional repressor HrcA [Gemmatimonadales bacterium]
MRGVDVLTDRELKVLEAVVETYIRTAEPAGSQTVARRYPLGLSPASIRSIMSDLEAKGYLFHTHASGGRIPTDRAYRLYVNDLMRPAPVSDLEREAIRRELDVTRSAIAEILRRAAQVLGVLTQELGVAAAPQFDQVILDRLDLVHIASDRLLLVFHLRSGAVRTIFVQIPSHVAPATVEHVARILNERLGGLTLREIRATLAERLRDADGGPAGGDLLNIFIAEGEGLFGVDVESDGVVLGSAELLAGQPEFSSNERIRGLLSLTERRDLLREALLARHQSGLSITIGSEHADQRLTDFTLVTSSYRIGDLTGVIGVIGPTRMPYDKIIGLVQHTSRLVEGLMT